MSNQVEMDVEISEEALEAAELELRNRTRGLSKKIEMTYWELGECLYSVFDGLPGGFTDKGVGSRARRTELFKKWGHKNFGEYVEKELGIRKRSAENLRYVYFYFEKKLRLPKEVKDEIKLLGRSKVYLLSGIATEDDIMTWIDKAKSMTFENLKQEIKLKKVNSQESTLDGQYAENPEIPGALPPPEKLHSVQAGLYDSQYDTYEQAIGRAKELSGSEKVGHNLELICQDFLANNDFKNSPAADKAAYLKKIEKQLGVALVAFDLQSSEPIYGVDLFWAMLKKAKGE